MSRKESWLVIVGLGVIIAIFIFIFAVGMNLPCLPEEQVYEPRHDCSWIVDNGPLVLPTSWLSACLLLGILVDRKHRSKTKKN